MSIEYKNKIGVALFGGDKINLNKSISDNNIKEESKVVLQINNDNNFESAPIIGRTDNDVLSDSISTQASIISLDEEDRKLLYNIYEILKKIEKSQNILIEQNEKNERNLLLNKINIITSFHEHVLVFLYSNRNWICNLCRNNYSKLNQPIIVHYVTLMYAIAALD